MKTRHDLWQARTADDFAARTLALGIDLKEMIATLSNAPQDTALMVVGSVAEGLANPESDVDLLLLVDSGEVLRKSTQADWSFSTGEAYKPATVKFFPKGVELDIEVCVLDRASTLKATTDTLMKFMSAPDSADGIPKLQTQEQRFLHQLRKSWVVANDPVAERWRRDLSVSHLPIYSMVTNYIDYMELLEDVVSALRKNDLLDVANVGRVCAEYGAQSLLGLGNETNPSRKWLAHLLTDLGRGKPELKPLTDAALGLLFPAPDMSEASGAQYVQNLRAFGLRLKKIMDGNVSLHRMFDMLFSKLHYIM
jgi:hypothetical protein